MVWKTFFHSVENSGRIFPHHGKLVPDFSTAWKLFFQGMEARGGGGGPWGGGGQYPIFNKECSISNIQQGISNVQVEGRGGNLRNFCAGWRGLPRGPAGPKAKTGLQQRMRGGLSIYRTDPFMRGGLSIYRTDPFTTPLRTDPFNDPFKGGGEANAGSPFTKVTGTRRGKRQGRSGTVPALHKTVGRPVPWPPKNNTARKGLRALELFHK